MFLITVVMLGKSVVLLFIYLGMQSFLQARTIMDILLIMFVLICVN